MKPKLELYEKLWNEWDFQMGMGLRKFQRFLRFLKQKQTREILEILENIGNCDEVKMRNGKYKCPWTPEGVALFECIENNLKQKLKEDK